MRVDDDKPVSVAHAPIGRLTRRAEFLHVGRGSRWHGVAMTIQAAPRSQADEGVARVGFTLTKKVGCAVVRNRARRRLREAVRLAPSDIPARPGHDYVLVGRVEAVRVPFAALAGELARGLAAVHERGKRRDKPKVEPVAAGMPGVAPRETKPKPLNAKSRRRTAPERIRPQP